MNQSLKSTFERSGDRRAASSEPQLIGGLPRAGGLIGTVRACAIGVVPALRHLGGDPRFNRSLHSVELPDLMLGDDQPAGPPGDLS